MEFHDIKDLTKLIDHTLLKRDATNKDIERICQEAIENKFYSVCVNPWWINKAKDILKHSDVKLCTVIGFPFGMTNIKLQEAISATLLGVDELDMVIAIGAVKSKFYTDVLEDIKKIVDLELPVKVILETCLFSDEEIIKMCEICIKAGAQFVKTSTGFAREGAKVETIKMIKEKFEDKIKIKASGGINSLEKLKSMIDAGASRIGTSNSIYIVNEFLKGKQQ